MAGGHYLKPRSVAGGGKPELTLDRAALSRLLNSRAVADACLDAANEIKDRADAKGITVGAFAGGSGEIPIPIDTKVETGRPVARAVVILAHPAGIAVESKHRLLGGSL